MRTWQPIETVPPYETVELYRQTDLHYVVGFMLPATPNGNGDMFMLEEGGPEDGEHRKYPLLKYKPTHWRYCDDLPAEWVSPAHPETAALR